MELKAQATNWEAIAAQHAKNEEFYHGLLTKIGEMFGNEAKRSDDGSLQQDVLALRVPDLVGALMLQADALYPLPAELAQMKRERDAAVAESTKLVTKITGLANELLDVRRVLEGEPPLNRFELPEMLANALAAKDEAVADNAALLSIFDGISNPRNFMLAVRQKKIVFLCTSKNSCTHCGGTGISSQEDLDGMTTHSGPCGYCLLGHPGTALLARHTEELAAKDEALENALAKWRDADAEITRLRKGLDCAPEPISNASREWEDAYAEWWNSTRQAAKEAFNAK